MTSYNFVHNFFWEFAKGILPHPELELFEEIGYHFNIPPTEFYAIYYQHKPMYCIGLYSLLKMTYASFVTVKQKTDQEYFQELYKACTNSGFPAHFQRVAEDIVCEYDSQLYFTRKRFLDYTLVTIHYTKTERKQYVVRHFDDIDNIAKYIFKAIKAP